MSIIPCRLQGDRIKKNILLTYFTAGNKLIKLTQKFCKIVEEFDWKKKGTFCLKNGFSVLSRLFFNPTPSTSLQTLWFFCLKFQMSDQHSAFCTPTHVFQRFFCIVIHFWIYIHFLKILYRMSNTESRCAKCRMLIRHLQFQTEKSQSLGRSWGGWIEK